MRIERVVQLQDDLTITIERLVYYTKHDALCAVIRPDRPLSDEENDRLSSWLNRVFEREVLFRVEEEASELPEIPEILSKLCEAVPAAASLCAEDFDCGENSKILKVKNFALMDLIEASAYWRGLCGRMKSRGMILSVELDDAGMPLDDSRGFYDEPVEMAPAPEASPSKSSKPYAPKPAKAYEPAPELKDGYQFGRFTKKDEERILPISEINLGTGLCSVAGEVVKVDKNVTKKGFLIAVFDMENEAGDAITCKAFFKPQKVAEADGLKPGICLIVKGRMQNDDFMKCNVFVADGARETEKPKPSDPAPVKRVELAVHTQMSNMEGLIDPKALAKRLKDWGHDAVAITDRGSVQAYPLVYDALKKSGIKLILGYHAKVLHDEHRILVNPHERDLTPIKGAYTVFDIETTGFSRFNDSIIEIGAVRYENGEKTGVFSEFINPRRMLPEKIIELTGITDAMLIGADTVDKVLPRFLEFAKDSILVAHNADFDVGFMIEKTRELGIEFQPVSLDTLGLARCLHPEFHNHKLDTLTKKIAVTLANHHRACDDAAATGEIFLKLMAEWEALGLPLEEINHTPSEFPMARHASHDALVYCLEQDALIGLYDMVSQANMKYFFKSPGIPDSLLQKTRKGLAIASGFVGSELFEEISRRSPRKRLLEIASRFDLLAVEPSCFWKPAENRELVADEDHYRSIVETVISLGEELKLPVVAIGSPRYLDQSERVAYNVLVNYQRKIEIEDQPRFKMMNTPEMLQAFSWLPRERAEELVIHAPRRFVEGIPQVLPIPEGTFTPKLEGAEEELRKITTERATKIYGDPLPEYVEERLERELKSIISHGYASLYVIAQKLVWKSNEDGYLVGSRGSVGSSFAATMAGITEVNPLVPHYVCPKCHHSEFIHDGSVGSGFDLPEKNCPECGTPMKRDGHDIPFEVFLGFHGDKEPDIDLNFAGEYMSVIHKYTETLFGEGKVFRAGTISGIQEKTAYGFIRKYLEQPYASEDESSMNEAKIRSIQRTLEGTKRTTGQHAGGLMIVPQDMSILQFCPIQYPADDLNSDVITTHFSYKNLSGRMLKLDELGHTSPTIIRQLEEMTGINPLDISFGDPETMSIFQGSEALKAERDYSNSNDGSLGIPEFGTNFVRGMLKDTLPSTFAELVRISGLSHGTDVWLNNAQDLVRAGTTDLAHAICTRDDIMIYLIQKGMDKLESFKTMEAVRKGKGIPEGVDEHMREHDVPEWYIESCNKIQYMFPKAHAVAYVMMSYRIAWFKVHSPAAFYATYYTQRLNDFSSEFLFRSLEQVQDALAEYKSKGESDDNSSAKITLLEVLEEMFARGYTFARPNLWKSEAASFTISDDRHVLPPLAALSGVSEAMAKCIVEERAKGEFLSREEFLERTGVPKKCMASLVEQGLMDEIPETDQVSFLMGF